jgi:plastocyanin
MTGPGPANPIIRMGADPMCSRMYGPGKRPTQQLVVRAADGALANVFVDVEGTFPKTAPPSAPVVLDQKGCIYSPRVVGVQVGQTLTIRNSDELLHNVHSLTAKGNEFNVSQPKAGMVFSFMPKTEEEMLRVKCDVHSWMTAYIGVVTNPYFSVSGTDGTFTIANVPAGRHTIAAWHEAYGKQMKTVDVKPGAMTTVEFEYTGTEKPSASLEQLTVPHVAPLSAAAITLLHRSL